MLRTLVPCGLAMALLASLGHAHATLAASNSAANAIVLPAPGPTSTRAILAQSQEMPAHGGHGDMASFAVGDLVVENPWARESVTRTGAAYLTVRNGGDQDDRLIGVSSEVADKALLHSSAMQDGVMKMRPVEVLEVPAHGEAVLEPGGLHIMLIGLKAPLEEGKSFALTLEFENAGEVEVVTTIEDIGHGGAGGHDHGHSN
jgi:copper(I)-binding protein